MPGVTLEDEPEKKQREIELGKKQFFFLSIIILLVLIRSCQHPHNYV